MAEFLYPSFLSDPAEYSGAEGVWRKAWLDLMANRGTPAGDWTTPWLRTTFVDGTAFRDGNPIFSAASASRRLGVRVIQLEPGDDPNELTFWTDYYAKGERDEVRELVIACVLTTSTIADATDLMSQWVKQGEITLNGPSKDHLVPKMVHHGADQDFDAP